jgi:hypothetical protein
MKHLMIQAILCLSIYPLLAAQQPTQAAPANPQPAQAIQITGTLELTHAVHPPAVPPPLTAADLDHNKILKNARTLWINSETAFLTSATLSRSLLGQKDWEKLGLSIISGPNYGDQNRADLEIQVNRVVFTHIHTYILSDKKTGVVLASGRVRAFDGVVASGPMAEQIVKVLSAARLPASPSSSDHGL